MRIFPAQLILCERIAAHPVDFHCCTIFYKDSKKPANELLDENILKDLRVETLDEFDRNLTRKALYYKSLALTHEAEFTVPKRQVVGDHPKIARLVKKTCACNIPASSGSCSGSLSPIR